MGSSAYTEHLLQQLNALREKETLCDASILGQEVNLPVHKVVLLAASPNFQKWIQADAYASGPDPVLIDLRKFDDKFLKTLVKYLYTGRLELSGENAEYFVHVFEELELYCAVKECQNFIEFGEKFRDVEIQTEELTEATNQIENESPPRKKRKTVLAKKLEIKPAVETVKNEEMKKKRTRKINKPRQRKSVPKKLKVKTSKEAKSEKEETNGVAQKDEKSSSETMVKVEKKDMEDTECSNIMLAGDENDDSDGSDTDDYESSIVENTKTEIAIEIVDDHIKTIDDEGRVVKKPRRRRAIGDGSKPTKVRRRRKPFPCSQCSKTLTSRKRLIFHEFSKHGTPIDYKSINFTVCPCEEEGCNYVAADRRGLDVHMKSRHGNARPHVCEFCGKAFKLPNILATHLNIHTNSKLWKCEHCAETFNQQSGLQVHVKRYHMGEASWTEMCHMCSDKFLQKADLAWHLYKVHNQPLPENYKMYTCDVCGFSTMKAQQLKQHRERHDGIKNFICPICAKGCSTKSELRRHVSFHGEKKFKCHFEGCSYACTDNIGLDKHIKLMHTHKDFKPYACPVCQYRTGVKGNVDKHIRAVHDLIVVTKHTVNLKMKYSEFDSGDVITKDGRLIATAKERKALQQVPAAMEKQMPHQADVHENLNSMPYAELKVTEPIQNTYLDIKKSKRHRTYRTEMLETISEREKGMNKPETDDSETSKMETIIQDLPPLHNYAYFQSEMNAAAQDLRLAAVTVSEPSSLYNMGATEMFSLQNKY